MLWFILAINIATFVAYGLDKAAAYRAWQRLPEGVLLLLGLSGGWPAGLIGQRLFRHKTRKQSFRLRFWVTVLLNVTTGGILVAQGVVP